MGKIQRFYHSSFEQHTAFHKNTQNTKKWADSRWARLKKNKKTRTETSGKGNGHSTSALTLQSFSIEPDQVQNENPARYLPVQNQTQLTAFSLETKADKMNQRPQNKKKQSRKWINQPKQN